MLNAFAYLFENINFATDTIAMNNERNTKPVVITKTSKKLETLLGQLKEQKLTQQTKLREMEECTFSVNI